MVKTPRPNLPNYSKITVYGIFNLRWTGVTLSQPWWDEDYQAWTVSFAFRDNYGNLYRWNAVKEGRRWVWEDGIGDPIKCNSRQAAKVRKAMKPG